MPLVVKEIQAFDKEGSLQLPVYACKLSAGFPSPADDYIERSQDLNELMVKNPAATYFVKVAGDSMIDAGIHSGDVLVVDKSLEATDGKIVVAAIDGELTVKKLKKLGKKLFLVAENTDYSPIEVNPESDFRVWGVVTYVIHKPH